MDERYNNLNVIDRRKNEWNPVNIKENVDILFRNVERIDGWSFVDSEWSERLKATTTEELKRSVLRSLKVKIKNLDQEQCYSILFPELIDGQFFYIGGYRKIPIFQMIDDPVIYRQTNKGDIIKLRTNTVSLNVVSNSRGEKLLSVFNKNVPIEKIITLVHTKEEYDEFLSRHDNPPPVINAISELCYNIWERNPEKKELHGDVGSYFMNVPQERFRKGENVEFSFHAAYQVDHFSKKFFTEESILFELLHIMWEGPRSDTDISKKRIRMMEYILSPLVRKMYDMLVTLYKNPRDRYQIPQNVVLELCNKSDIVHFNFPLNPIGEIANMFQCSLTGPGGFRKDNVPLHLRNIDESHFGRFCGADTPDRDGCGVILNMVPITNINEEGKFEAGNEDIIHSYPISLTPFLQNDDQTRLQMASNQAKQTIMIKEGKKPTIRTGVESSYLNKTSFLCVAKEDGTVIYKDKSFFTMRYTNGEHEVINVGYRPLYLNTVDYIEPMLEEGAVFKKGDILCQSKFIQDGELAIGNNFLTAIMPFEGFNYEDGIVISESVTHKMTSMHFIDLSFEVDPGYVLLSLVSDKYKPFPNIGDKLKTGEVYAKIKTFDWEEGYENINEEPREMVSPIDCRVVSIEVYPNEWNRQIHGFDAALNKIMGRQVSKYNLILNSLSENMTGKEIKDFIICNGISRLNCNKTTIGKFSSSKEVISGVKFKISAIYEERIGIGDKIANRHGNKGVISRIVPDDKMPLLDDGRRAEIVINPLGVISRMNWGQVNELHVNEAIYQLKKKMHERTERGALILYKKFLDIIDNSDDKWASKESVADYKKTLLEKGKDSAVEDVHVIMPAYQSTSPEQIMKCMKLVDARETFKINLPVLGDVENEIACGYMYWLKLVHRARDKSSSRSIGPYSRKTSQPLGGKKRKGGHRLGEMEQWALASHGAKVFLKDLLTTHSDSSGLKNKVLAEMLQNPDLVRDDDEEVEYRPQSLMLLDSYLKQLGMETVFEEDS